MRDNDGIGEDAPVMESEDIEEVQRRLREIQRHKRERIRWSMSQHTAELAIDALDGASASYSRSGKSHRRKRHKRLL